jgi:hypothetical protein
MAGTWGIVMHTEVGNMPPVRWLRMLIQIRDTQEQARSISLASRSGTQWILAASPKAADGAHESASLAHVGCESEDGDLACFVIDRGKDGCCAVKNG